MWKQCRLVGGGATSLEAELQQLMDLRRVNQELLVQIEELLQKQRKMPNLEVNLGHGGLGPNPAL